MWVRKLPIRELKSNFTSFGPVKKKVLVEADGHRVTSAPSGIKAGFLCFCRKEEDSLCHPEEKGNRLVQRTGMQEEEVGRQEIQKWNDR
jgi:hypothetical protein